MTNHRDRAYWEDVFNAFYIRRGFGKYDEAYQAFCQEYPDFVAFSREVSQETIERDFIKRVASRFAQADHEEHQPAPTPPHLRHGFLPFLIDVPPMSASLNAFDGQGRVAMADATPKQHRNHHRAIKVYHHRGFVYRERAEAGWTELMAKVKERLPDIDHPENLTLQQVLEHLKQTDPVEERDQPTTAATPV